MIRKLKPYETPSIVDSLCVASLPKQQQTKTLYFNLICVGILPACMSMCHFVYLVSPEVRNQTQVPWKSNKFS